MNAPRDAMSNDVTNVLHNLEQNRFELGLGERSGELAVLEYVIKTAGPDGHGTLSITHTYVPHSARGHGVAARLTRAALEYAEQHALTVVPLCSYAASYLARQNRRTTSETSNT